ncbi:MAG TPA: hypothetical protein VMR21_13365 [Vicinamibacteria bacterium]|nr:hypothetical protein [Vicinamibacteria bacterium]
MRIGQFIFLALLLLGPPLLSVIGRWLKRQMAEAEGRGEAASSPPEGRRKREGGEKPHRGSEAPHIAAPVPAVAPPARAPASAPRRPALPGLRSPRELRHSIVVAAVLGPCRAMEP